MMTHLDIIVLLLVVVVIFQRLKSLLGTRPNQEHRVQLSKENAEKLYNILMKEADRQQNLQNQASEEENVQNGGELSPVDEELSAMDKVLAQIPNFNKSIFLNNAKNAFEVITEAFNRGDLEALEMLVSPTILKKFQEVIEKRSADKISAETDFICFDQTEILHAQINENQVAQITVKYVSEQVNVLRDAEGNVIEGDENYIQNIEDVWTYERAVNSTAPNWILVSTKKS